MRSTVALSERSQPRARVNGHLNRAAVLPAPARASWKAARWSASTAPLTQALMHALHRQLSAVDAVRVMVRLLKQASACLARPRSSGAITAGWPRSAPRYPIQRGKAQKAKLYRELIAATRATVSTLEHAVQRLAAGATIQAELWLGKSGIIAFDRSAHQPRPSAAFLPARRAERRRAG